MSEKDEQSKGTSLHKGMNEIETLTLIMSWRLESPKGSVSCSEHSSKSTSRMIEQAVSTAYSLSFTNKGRKGRMMGAFGSHKTLPNSVTRNISNYLACLQTNGQTTSTFTRQLSIRGMLTLLGNMRGLGRWSPTLSSKSSGLFDLLLPIFCYLLVLHWLHLWNRLVG